MEPIPNFLNVKSDDGIFVAGYYVVNFLIMKFFKIFKYNFLFENKLINYFLIIEIFITLFFLYLSCIWVHTKKVIRIRVIKKSTQSKALTIRRFYFTEINGSLLNN